ncbi:MAG: hypothetical protein LBK94_04870 [Prevotellaceae bacterium]|jgi:tetratricopeptide (TPR) repeat protein|nr:hypothetical protein [Prevotellaceae bacterium]
MKNILLLISITAFSLQLAAQDCSKDENFVRFMTRGRLAIKTAENPEEYKLAADEFTKALEYDAKCPDIYEQLAFCYEQMGKLDPGNYQQAINCLNTCLSFRPDAANKQEIQEKVYELEFLLEKAGGTSLKNLIGKWKFYWGDGDANKYDFYDIEIFQNNSVYYVKYLNYLYIDYEINNRIDKIMMNKYTTTEITYDAGFISFEINNKMDTNTHYTGQSSTLNRAERTVNYKLKIENNMLKGERFCTLDLFEKSFIIYIAII